jgi:hypothetical protein
MLVIIRLEHIGLFCKTLMTRHTERHFLLLETECLFGCKNDEATEEIRVSDPARSEAALVSFLVLLGDCSELGM